MDPIGTLRGPRGAPLPEDPREALRLGVVVIGRNEGERLIACLRSISASPIVYVDSGSSDGSVDGSRRLGVEVLELDRSRPFTAARARNAGHERLSALRPDLEFVQFVDGDCELQPGWLEAASRYLQAHPEVAVVCGRRRERFPDASLYNRIIDMEWDSPPGDIDACGGDAMIREGPFRQVGGYDGSLIAGEDPELCLRIRRAGYRVVRLGHEMTLHDADLRSVGQWWRRQVRSGHAFAELATLHLGEGGPHRMRRLVSIAFWGGALPGLCLLAAWPTSGWSLLLLGALALPWSGSYRESRRRWSARDAARYASACSFGKFAEFAGIWVFAWNRWVRRRATRLIEYKGPRSIPRGRFDPPGDPGGAG